MYKRLIILFLVILAVDSYVFYSMGKSLNSLGWIFRDGTTIIYWASLFLLLILIADALGSSFLSHTAVIYLRAFVFIAYFSKVLMLIPFLLTDIYHGAIYLFHFIQNGKAVYDRSGHKVVTRIALGMAALPSVTLLYGLLGNQYRFKTRAQEIMIADLPRELDGMKIIQLSDIHSGTFPLTSPLKKVVENINKLQADIVVFTGDLVNDKAEEALRFIDIFSQIKARYGVYSILGNHDYGDYVRWINQQEKEENLEKLVSIHKEMGWDILRNAHRKITINGKEIAIIGVENYSTMERFPRHGDLAKAALGTEDCALRILLSHDPTHWDYEVNKKYKDIALTLSGHTHGFQFGIEIPGIFRWSPSQYIFDQWAGLYKKGKQYIYVNRGLGCLGYPGRVGILPEITEITLYSA